MVTAFLSNNHVPAHEVPELVRQVRNSILSLSNGGGEEPGAIAAARKASRSFGFAPFVGARNLNTIVGLPRADDSDE